MSLSAPPRCSLFVPALGTKQLALVKKELQFLKHYFAGESQFAAPHHITSLLPDPPPLLLPPRAPFPPPFLYVLHQRYFLVLADQHAAHGSGCEVRQSLRTNSSINRRARRASLPLCVPANSGHASPHRRREGTQPLRKGTNKGPLTGGTGAEIHHTPSYKFNLVNCQSMPSTPGTIQDIQPTWLNSISKGDGRSRGPPAL